MPTPTRTPAPRHPFLTWLNSPEQLARTLVGRDPVMRALLQGIAATTQGGPANHVLLVGPRGIGKTHILSLLDHYASGRLQPPEEFRQAMAPWVPVFFSEEEFAGQNSLANFLLTALHKLGEANGQEELWKLPADLPAQGDAAVTECCFERIRRFHADRGRRVLFLIDHIQRILQQWASDDHDSLRAFLSGQGFVLLIGTAPSVFREVLSQRAAFHQFFDIQILHDLSEEDTLEFLRRLYCEDGREADFDARREELSRKLPAVLTLTGGNPRLILFLYQVAARSTFLEIETALSELLDGLHDYFLQRFERLSDQPRKVLDTIAQMPGPATPTEIAQAARLTPALVNAQLRRLKRDHYVQVVKFARHKSTRYDITERLFRIWRQTATVAGKRRFRFLTDFLKLYFTPDEVRSLYAHHAALLGPGMAGGREAMIRHIEELFYLQSAAYGGTRRDIFATRIEALLGLGETQWAEEEADHLLSESLANGDNASAVAANTAKADIHMKAAEYVKTSEDIGALVGLKAFSEAHALAERLVALAPDLPLAWLRLAGVALRTGEYERALEGFRTGERLGVPGAGIVTGQAHALVLLQRYQEAADCAQRAVALDPKEQRAWYALGAAALATGDNERALSAFSKAAEVGNPTSGLWRLQAVALNFLDRPEEAIAAAERALAIDPCDALSWREVGFARLFLNDERGSLEAFMKATGLAEQGDVPWRALALSLEMVRISQKFEADFGSFQEQGVLPDAVGRDRADILLLNGRYEDAARCFGELLVARPHDWILAADREIAVACLGRYGPHMEALPTALQRVGVPTQVASAVFDFALDVADRASIRGEADVWLGMLGAVTSIPTWRACEWFRQRVGALLRRAVDFRPQEFLAAMEIVRQNVTEEDVLRLLDPFVQAAEFIRTRDLTLLERLFPEVRELVLDIVHRVAPELDELVKPAK